MKRIFLSFTLIVGWNMLFAQSPFTLYLPPCAKMIVDTQIWSCNTFQPSMMSVAEYYNKQKNSITHKTSSLIIYYEAEFYNPCSEQQPSSSFKKVVAYGKLLSRTTTAGENSLSFVADSACGIKFKLSWSIESVMANSDAKILFESLMSVTAEELDALVGYPLLELDSSSSYYNNRRKEFETNYEGEAACIYIDGLIQRERDIRFSFSKWKEYATKENSFLCSECELGLQDENVVPPKETIWLSHFVPTAKPNSDSRKNSKLYNYLKGNNRDFLRAVKLNPTGNHKGMAYAYYTIKSDQVAVKSFVKNDQGTCHSCSLDIHSEFVNMNTGNLEPLYIIDYINKTAWNNYGLDASFNEFIVQINRQTKSEIGFQGNFSKLYLMSTDIPLEKPIEFGFPTTDKSVELFVESKFSEESQKRLSYSISQYEKGIDSCITIPFRGYTTKHYRTSNAQLPIPPSKRLYRSPILVGDFNHNGLMEFLCVFVQSGGIVYSEFYEKNATSIRKIPTTKTMEQGLYKVAFIQTLLFLSSTPNMEDGQNSSDVWSTFSNAAHYNPYDFTPVVEMESWEESVDGLDVSPGPVEEVERDMYYNINEVDVPAEFPGGNEAMEKYIRKTKKLPDSEKHTENLYVEMTILINTNGEITLNNVTTNGKNKQAMKEEAARICKLMPLWHPAQHNGRKVNMGRTIKIQWK